MLANLALYAYSMAFQPLHINTPTAEGEPWLERDKVWFGDWRVSRSCSGLILEADTVAGLSNLEAEKLSCVNCEMHSSR